jgi:hypothetical protein
VLSEVGNDIPKRKSNNDTEGGEWEIVTNIGVDGNKKVSVVEVNFKSLARKGSVPPLP